MRFVATKKYENVKTKKSELRFARIHDPAPVRRIGGNDVGCLHNKGGLDRKNDPGLHVSPTKSHLSLTIKKQNNLDTLEV